MLSLLFSSNYPGAHAPLWQYFGASLDHSVLALCFFSFLIGNSTAAWSLRSQKKQAISSPLV
jgi:thiosulfate dehydrogenase [quinone] large subunit